MERNKLKRLLLAGCLLSEDERWETEGDQADAGPAEQPKRKRIWVRPWIRRRMDEPANTMYKLQCEITAVSKGTPTDD